MAIKKSKGMGAYLAVLLLLMLLAVFIFTPTNNGNTLTYSQVLQYFENGQVSEFVIDCNQGDLTMKVDGVEREVVYRLPSISIFLNDVDLEAYSQSYNAAHPDAPLSYDYIPAEEPSLLLTMLPTLLLLVGMVIFWVLMMRQAGGGGGKISNFSKAKAKPVTEGRKVTFADVAGADEEKQELEETVELLKNPGKFNMLGARVPKGVLLMGPPGTGKTLLARAVAGEAGVPFFSISGSDFVEMFVGVGASRVRDLFEQAKKNAPSIIFIDEIDAVGRHRGAGLGGGHDEREQTLNQLLVEMDGFGANTGVIVIAATNRSDILDPALLRPGRFDRQIVVNYPDVKGREEILRVHTRNKPLGPDVDLRVIAQTTIGFTGADLENLANEAALLAARKNRKAITMADIEEATIKVIAGPEKRSHKVSDKDRNLTCYHEAGHAVTTYYCPTQSAVHQVSIIPRGMAGGYTLSLPEDDRNYKTKREMYEEIVTLLGGRVAEKLVLDDISTGASNDIERASKIARNMVTRYGFSEKLGPIVYGQDQGEIFLGRDLGQTRNYSENVAAEIDQEVREIVDTAYERCKEILEEHRDQLERVAQYLKRREKIDAETFRLLMETDLSYEELDAKAEARRLANDPAAATPSPRRPRTPVEQAPTEEPQQAPSEDTVPQVPMPEAEDQPQASQTPEIPQEAGDPRDENTQN